MPIELDSAIRNTMMFRQVFGTQDDHYVPEVAHYVTDVIAGLDEETRVLVLSVVVDGAVGALAAARN